MKNIVNSERRISSELKVRLKKYLDVNKRAKQLEETINKARFDWSKSRAAKRLSSQDLLATLSSESMKNLFEKPKESELSEEQELRLFFSHSDKRAIKLDELLEKIENPGKDNDPLDFINLAKEEINDEGLEKLLQKSSKFKNSLKMLFLGGNNLTPTGATHLSKFLSQNQVLRCLDLRWNQIGLEGLKILAPSLKACKSLKYLNLEGNELGLQVKILSFHFLLYGIYFEKKNSI